MPTLALADIDLYYEELGAGPDLLFANGSGSSIEAARPLIERFAEHFHVLVHDQRGLGKSAIPPGPYSMADYAADAAALLDHLEWDRARVVGISFGGMVAQELAVTWPERVECMALLCTSPGGIGGASFPLHELAGLPAEEARVKGFQLLDSRFTPEWLDAHPRDRALAEAMAARRLGSKTPDQLRGGALQLEARSRHDVCDRLARVTCPTLIAAGRFDAIAPPTNAEAIAARIPGADLRFYEGGHAFLAQDRTATPDVLGFLNA